MTMIHYLTPADDDAIERACYDARWGYDGMGSIGPKVAYEDYERQRRSANALTTPVARRGALARARHHRRGNGWRANHEGNV